MSITQQDLTSLLQDILSDKIISLKEQLGEITIVVQPKDILGLSQVLRDHPKLNFDMLLHLVMSTLWH